MLTTTSGKIYLVSIDNPEQIVEMQFVPDTLHVNRAVRMEHIQIIGQNNSFYQYISGAKDIEFDGDFYADIDSNLQVTDKMLLLESWTMNEGYRKPPARVSLIWGDMSKILSTQNVWVIKNIGNITYSLFDEKTNMMPRQVRFKLELSNEPAIPIKASDVVNQIVDIRYGHGGY